MEKNTEKLYCYLPAKPYVQPGSIHFQLLYIQQHRSLLVLHLHTPGEQIQNIGVQLLVLHLHTPEAQILNIGVYWYSTYICQGNKSRIQESIGTPPTYAGGTNLEYRSLLVLHLRTPEHKSRIYESIGTPPTYAGGTNLDYRSLLVLHQHYTYTGRANLENRPPSPPHLPLLIRIYGLSSLSGIQYVSNYQVNQIMNHRFKSSRIFKL